MRVLFFALVCPLVAGSHVSGNEPDVIRVKERSIPLGQLPTWETEAERRALSSRPPRVTYVNDGLLPPPPAPGYRVPGEFEPVSAFMVSEGDWGNYGMMVDMINQGTSDGGAAAIVLTRREVSSFESILVSGGVDLSRVIVMRPPGGLNARWTRDFGPLSVYEPGPADENGPLAFVDLHYYDSRERDDAVTEYLAGEMGLSRYGLEGNDQTPVDEYKLYMEGGNYMTDGRGTCILSDDVPDDNQNNPDANTYEKAEQILAEYLGCERIIWLTPVPSTSTSHVDLYAKLLTPDDILVIDMPDQTGNNGRVDEIVDDNADTLSMEGFNVHRVMIPSMGNWWTYKTYTNSVIINQVVLVPTYSSAPYDNDALDMYREILGGEYKVIGIDATAIAPLGGSVHCTTMQIASGCGDGILSLLLEECDDDDLGGETCESLGLEPGDLACDEDCRIDTSPCGAEPEDPDGGSGADAGTDTDTDTDTKTEGDAGPNNSSEGWGSEGCGCRTTGRFHISLLPVLLSH
ncbi:MAG: agmatine deiminase family protein [Deltaproteobacteria bacterium]|nr:agmatine deiminase family protein [Deltaproteobacteria bacterium]